MAGQVFKGRRTSLPADRPHKSLHVLGRRPKTNTLVTALRVARASDMPSKPVWGRELPGGFDSPSASATFDLRKRSSEGSGRTPFGSEAEFAQVDSYLGGVACAALRPQASYLVVTRTSLAALSRAGYARLSSSTGMVRTPAVWRSYSAKPG